MRARVRERSLASREAGYRHALGRDRRQGGDGAIEQFLRLGAVGRMQRHAEFELGIEAQLVHGDLLAQAAHQARGAVARRGIRGTRLDPEAEQLGVDARQQRPLAAGVGQARLEPGEEGHRGDVRRRVAEGERQLGQVRHSQHAQGIRRRGIALTEPPQERGPVGQTGQPVVVGQFGERSVQVIQRIGRIGHQGADLVLEFERQIGQCPIERVFAQALGGHQDRPQQLVQRPHHGAGADQGGDHDHQQGRDRRIQRKRMPIREPADERQEGYVRAQHDDQHQHAAIADPSAGGELAIEPEWMRQVAAFEIREAVCLDGCLSALWRRP
jgi:hypothetical protein